MHAPAQLKRIALARNVHLLKALLTLFASGEPNPELFVVIWNGELLEGEWPDAIAFSRADAEAVVARSPGRTESYSIEAWTFRALIQAPTYAPSEAQLREKIERGDRTPLMLRPDEWRAKRAH